eukprot:UN28091
MSKGILVTLKVSSSEEYIANIEVKANILREEQLFSIPVTDNKIFLMLVAIIQTLSYTFLFNEPFSGVRSI